MKKEGQAMNRPPLFRGTKYDYWKERMIAFFNTCHIGMWDVVEQGKYTPLDEAGNEIPKAHWSEEQKQRFMLNSKARNAFMCALSEEEYNKVHGFKSAKQMWDTLAITYEGSFEVSILLARKYELFKMEENKSIQTMFGRFQTIVNELFVLGRTYDNFDHIDKLLRSLPRKKRPQVIALKASKNLKKLSLEELIGLLKVYELELQQDDARRKQKSIALTKSTPSSSKALRAKEVSYESCGEETCDSDEEISFLSRRIHSMMKKKGGTRWRKFNKTPRDKAQPVCFECKKPGHYKIECPALKKEKEKEKKKLTFHKKKKAMMATWEDLDMSSSKDDEEANIRHKLIIET
uniref:CCHC-type domain-containing protein n=1 Tax=Cajanus cajan TaxID=3821 RepID=A0A151RFK8_CAJCA|nr:hypothetical protein KK1_037375 [Cajanus cajan]